MKKLSTSIYIVLLSLSILSCNKGFLDREPLTSYSDATVWGDINLVKAYVNDLYTVLPDGGGVRALLLSPACDEGFNKFDYNGVRSIINAGALTPDNIGSFDVWKNTYSQIQKQNIFIGRIGEVPGDATDINLLKGQVHYLRAYSYFTLTRDYGGVPLITKQVKLDDNFDIPRASFEECLDFMIAELDEAATLLSAGYTAEEDKGRITAAAALALKSRILLYAASPLWNPTNDLAKWEKASKAAKAVIDLPGYHLIQSNESPYPQIFSTNFNAEIIFSRANNQDYGYHIFDTWLSPNSYHGWAVHVPTQNLVDAFNMANGKMIDEAGSGYNPQDPYAGRDPRFYADIVYDGRGYRRSGDLEYRGASGNVAEFFEGGLDSDAGLEEWNNSLTRYTFRKYCDTTFNMAAINQSNQPWIISRLAEIYLNYAEAEYHLGHQDVTREYINLVRARAGVTTIPVATKDAELLKRIYNERQVELCLEGHRYYDVRRWKIAEITENKPVRQVIITRLPDGSRKFVYQDLENRVFHAPQNYLLPIPLYELQRTTSLTQNPGYN
ncbi:RagB/SusD family nutrient uptake outer membrane protein [Chitinophaga sp. MM2321]|uniref:RagB/SusD family nutrient uptake outer membrane protein n=1 Tax=Chitinophaga sp. MM2321 TaxID=3137178 RepID=UPI0032D5A04F